MNLFFQKNLNFIRIDLYALEQIQLSQNSKFPKIWIILGPMFTVKKIPENSCAIMDI